MKSYQSKNHRPEPSRQANSAAEPTQQQEAPQLNPPAFQVSSSSNNTVQLATDDEKKWGSVSKDKERAKHLNEINPLVGLMLETFKTSTLFQMAKERHEELMDPTTGHHTKIAYAKELIQIYKIVEGRALDYALSKQPADVFGQEDDITSVMNPNDPFFAINIKAKPFNNLPFWQKMVDRGPVAEPKLTKYGDKPKKTPEYAYAPAIAELFIEGSADKGDIDPNDVIQNQLGDCYFLAGVAAVARANPEALRQLITDNKDGTYTVKLYAQKSGKITESPTEITVTNAIPLEKLGPGEKDKTERSQPYAEAGENKESVELWVMILEKAYAKLRGGYNVLDKGGFGKQGLGALTGQTGKNHYPSGMKLSKMKETLKEALDKKWPITAETGHIGKKKAKSLKLVTYHAYTPVSINDSTEMIKLQNPWGPGHGTEISLKDFKKHFRWFTILHDYDPVKADPE